MSHMYSEASEIDRLRKEINELREKGDYYRNILESADKGIWVINNNYKTVYINFRMAEMLGTTINKVMGGTVLKYLDEDNWRNFMDILTRCHEGCKEQFDIKFRRADGGEIWALANLAPFLDVRGSRIAVSGTFVDITERKQMEKALKETRDNLVKAQHVGRMGSWVRDLKTDMFESSGEMGEILGVEAVPMKTEDVSRLFYSPGERERVRRISQEAIEKTGSFKTDVRMARPDGKEIYCHLEAEVVRDDLGRPVKVVGILQDITERKNTELALREARAELEFFIDLISHDIGNMNHALLGYLELSLEKWAPSGKDNELLAKPVRIVKDSMRLIDDVRNLRQVVSGKMPVKKTDAGSILTEAIADLPLDNGRDIRINYTPGSGCPAMANGLLKDAFSHIISNSIKHSSGPLTIDIKMDEAQVNGQAYCRIGFEDNGPGVPDEMKSKLLMGVKEAVDRNSRIGLGLCFVKTLVDSYQGKVWMEDRVPGDFRKGARVVLMIPKAE